MTPTVLSAAVLPTGMPGVNLEQALGSHDRSVNRQSSILLETDGVYRVTPEFRGACFDPFGRRDELSTLDLVFVSLSVPSFQQVQVTKAYKVY